MNKEIVNSVKDFLALLDRTTDDAKHLQAYMGFLRGFVRIKSDNPLPTPEIMTLIKHEKPIIFSLIRKQKHQPLFSFLIQLDMDYEKAKDKLNAIVNKAPTE